MVEVFLRYDRDVGKGESEMPYDDDAKDVLEEYAGDAVNLRGTPLGK